MSLISESWIFSFNNPNTEATKAWTQDDFFGEIRRLSGIPLKQEDIPGQGSIVVVDKADRAAAERALKAAGFDVSNAQENGKNVAIQVGDFDKAAAALDKAKIGHYASSEFKLEATEEIETGSVDAENALDEVTEEYMALSKKLKELGAGQDNLHHLNNAWNHVITSLERKLGVSPKE